MTIDVSVIIGTYNRAQLLGGTLRALALQQVPESLKWEILVIDNNSTDRTKESVAAFSSTASVPVRYVFEAHQGISHARNRGITEARGSLLAFTDDDVLPAQDWIVQVTTAMRRWNADGVGGRILPQWEASPPRWLTRNRYLLDRLAIMEFAESRVLQFPIGKEPQVWGANMAFRRKLFDQVGGFSTRLGGIGNRLFRGEEPELINRALQHGLKIVYDPAVVVLHRIGAERTRTTYFRKLIFDVGEGEARANPIVRGYSFLGAPLWRYRVAFANFWRWVGQLLLRHPDAFDRQLDWLSSLGQLSGYWKSALERCTTRYRR
jgi:glycosyltransferase involved in cell wall biosynthesis